MIMHSQLEMGSPEGNRPSKDQEEYEALMKCHGSTIQWNLTP